MKLRRRLKESLWNSLILLQEISHLDNLPDVVKIYPRSVHRVCKTNYSLNYGCVSTRRICLTRRRIPASLLVVYVSSNAIDFLFPTKHISSCSPNPGFQCYMILSPSLVLELFHFCQRFCAEVIILKGFLYLFYEN